ncbi:MAG: PhnD/SsuA/transferrin family substrate-binding protein [Aquabacterium sp.]|nr:PhnD/SsuA/transferrin family substrate-binding protein [Aquabacterium sp.]
MIDNTPALRSAWRQGFSRMAVACALASGLWGAPALAQPATAAGPFEVVQGDSFSLIAGRVLGSPRNWAQLYNPRLSGLPDPNRIAVGQRFELVTEPGGTRYLRLMGSKPVAMAAAASPAPAPAAPPAPAPAATTAVAPAPAPAPTPAPSPAPALTPPAAAVATAPAAAGDDTLVIGVLPFIGTAALQAQYENLKSWMERTQGTKVRITVPANFKVFFENTMRGDYDLSVAAPHFARVAQVDRGLVPVAMYEPRINALFVGKPDDGINGPADLRGKALGFANPTSLVAMYGLQFFRQAGMEPGKDFEIRGARTDMGVGRMLLAGEVSGAIMSNGEFRALPQDEAARLRTVEAFARIPNFIIVAHPRLGPVRINRLKTQLKAFIADKDEGAAFVKATGITNMIDIDDAVLRELDPYVAPTRRAMGVVN